MCLFYVNIQEISITNLKDKILHALQDNKKPDIEVHKLLNEIKN